MENVQIKYCNNKAFGSLSHGAFSVSRLYTVGDKVTNE
jgi:hypothetical protein